MKKSRGERVGAIPFGQRLAADGVHLEVEPAEQIAMSLICDWREAGLGFAAIARRLNLAGIHKPRGKRWYAMTILRITANSV